MNAKNMISHLESHTDIDQFQQYVDDLVSGYSVTDWSSGKSKYIMRCSSSWEALEFVSKSGKLKKTVFLNMFRSVTVGRRPGGHSTLIGKARSDCAFYLECTNNNKTKKKKWQYHVCRSRSIVIVGLQHDRPSFETAS